MCFLQSTYHRWIDLWFGGLSSATKEGGGQSDPQVRMSASFKEVDSIPSHSKPVGFSHEHSLGKWLWLKIQELGLRGFSLRFHLARCHFGLHLFEPQPNCENGVRAGATGRALVYSAWTSLPSVEMPKGRQGPFAFPLHEFCPRRLGRGRSTKTRDAVWSRQPKAVLQRYNGTVSHMSEGGHIFWTRYWTF